MIADTFRIARLPFGAGWVGGRSQAHRARLPGAWGGLAEAAKEAAEQRPGSTNARKAVGNVHNGPHAIVCPRRLCAACRDRARRGQQRPCHGRSACPRPADTGEVPGDDPDPAQAGRAHPQPARARRRLLAGAPGGGDLAGRHHQGHRRPVARRPGRAPGEHHLPRRGRTAAAGVDRAARQRAGRTRAGHAG